MGRDAMAERVRALAEPEAAALGLAIYDLEVVRGRRLVIRLVAERESKHSPTDGITVAECAALSRRVEQVLDLEQAVPSRYALEVSSPGLERRLKSPAQFAGAIGEWVRVVAAVPIDGQPTVEGTLVEVVGAEQIVLDLGERRVSLPLVEVRRAQTVFRG